MENIIIGDYSFSLLKTGKCFSCKRISNKKVFSPIHSKIIYLLMTESDSFICKITLMQKIWRYHDYFINRTFDVHICKLRKYFRDNDPHITIITGTGKTIKMEINN